MQIEEVFRLQAGAIGRDQALAAGLSERQVDRRVATGQWRQFHPRVYVVVSQEITDHTRVHAAALWAGEPSTVSGLAAAWWLGLWPEPPSTVEITTPERRYPRARPGVRVRRRDLANADRIGVRGIWLTAIPLTALEAAVALGDRGPELMDRALQRRVRLDALHRAHHRNLGRRGSAAAGRLLAAATGRAASEAERRMIALLRQADMRGWMPHYPLNGYELDLAFPEHRLAIEVDGWAWHQDAEAFRKDRRRQNAIVLAGWTILRFTWHDLTVRPDDVSAEIQAATNVTARAPAGGTPFG